LIETTAITAVGVLGFVLILAAFGLNALGRVTSTGYLYAVLNLTGSGILAWYATFKVVPVFLALEVVWAGIALVTIVRRFLQSQQSSSRSPR
jgi:hypothetical protein